jgi:hypothetical protein
MMLFGTLSNRPKRVLEPMEKISEILFALIMVLTFTCSFSIAGAGREGVRELVIGALGCNLAWGLIDAAFYLMGSFSMLGQGILQLKALSQAASQAEALFGLGKNEMSDVVLIPGSRCPLTERPTSRAGL